MILRYLTAWAILGAAGLWGQPSPAVRLKTSGARSTARDAGVVSKRLAAGSWHLLLIFQGSPGAAAIERLQSRGARVVQVVPDRGIIAAVPETTVLDDIEFEWVGRLRPEQKMSPILVESGMMWTPESDLSTHTVLVESYLDVPRSSLAEIAAREGLRVVENAGLSPWQMMVEGTATSITRLAEWDEIGYLFPASDLARGSALACAGALTSSGRVGQISASVGDGWDGPGRGSTDVGYYFSSFTGRLSAEDVRRETLRAMMEWAKAVKVRFVHAPSGDATRTINVLFSSGDHGDGYSFDGSGKSLAHTFFPMPPNPEPIAGDLHLDDAEPWQTGSGVDLFSVVLHELGHALGLGHSDNPAAVMYPYYRRSSTLSVDDIASIREIYAAQDGTPYVEEPVSPPPAEALQISADPIPTSTMGSALTLTGTTSGGTGTVQISWANSRGGTGNATGYRPWNIAAIPLSIGGNLITLTAVDSLRVSSTLRLTVTRNAATPETFAIRLLSPTTNSSYATNQSSVNLSGTISPAGRVARVFWVNQRGAGGSVSGTESWSTGPIGLEIGANRITVTAIDSLSQIVSVAIDVQYSVSSDRTAPVLTVLSPGSSTWSTTSSTVTIAGVATDNFGVTEVNWIANYDRVGKATGTVNWVIPDYPLLPGLNTIMIRAFDGAGNMSWRSLAITRQ